MRPIGAPTTQRGALIDGVWRDTADRRAVHSPFDGSQVGAIAWVGPSEATEAIAAHTAMATGIAAHECAAILERLSASVTQHEAEFALLAGGEIRGQIVIPTVLSGAPAGCDLQRREVFGAVVAVQRYSDFAEALALQRDRLRPAGRRLHTADRPGVECRGGSGVRRGADQRGPNVSCRPDALGRRQGLGLHARRTGLRRARDDQRAALAAAAHRTSMSRELPPKGTAMSPAEVHV